MTSPYRIAKDEGYSDEDILGFLNTHPKYSKKIKEARDEGYSDEEISDFLSKFNPQAKKRTVSDKIGRTVAQYALGAAEASPPGMVYEAAVAPLSKPAQTTMYRENLLDDLETFTEAKQMGGFPGKSWDENDEKQLESIIEQIKNPRKSEQFVKSAEIGIQPLAEKALGMNLEPENLAEKSARWVGFIKDPKKLTKMALNPKSIIKAISPTGTEILRGIGAGAALQIAEDGHYGPIGKMAAAIVGDVSGAGVGSGLKTAGKLIVSPQETVSKLVKNYYKLFTSKEKKALQKDVVEDFRKSGIQADLGTITDSELIKMGQSRIAQSGLTGSALDDFKDRLTSEIREEYENLARNLGEFKNQTEYEAGRSLRDALKDIRDKDLSKIRKFYSKADESLVEGKSFVDSSKLASYIGSLENKLSSGAIKSSEQQAVLNTIKDLKKDLYDESGKLRFADVKSLMNNKIAINDVINYETQGGAKQLLKGIVSEIDKAIISHGKDNPIFAKNYKNAEEKFADHAKTFRNRNIDHILRLQDPEKAMTAMNSIQGIRDVNKILSKTSGGKELFNSLKRHKLDQVVGNNLIDSTTKQVKLGTFSKLLEKGKNAELIKEILGTESFKRLERLQKNSGRLAESAQKFFNASKSGSTILDAGIVAKLLSDFSTLLSGNPWPLVKLAGGIGVIRKLSRLTTDPTFLRLCEDAIIAAAPGKEAIPLSQKAKSITVNLMIDVAKKLRPYALAIYGQSSD